MSENELKQAVFDVLERNGELGRIKAELRSSVYKSLVQSGTPRASHQVNNSETFGIIYSLIREFLQWNELNHTKHTLETESALQPETLPSRTQILQQFHLTDSEQSKQLVMNVSPMSGFSSIHSDNDVKEEENIRDNNDDLNEIESLNDFINYCNSKSENGAEIMKIIKNAVLDDFAYYISISQSAELTKNLTEKLKLERKEIENKIELLNGQISNNVPSSNVNDRPYSYVSTSISNGIPMNNCSCGCIAISSKSPPDLEKTTENHKSEVMNRIPQDSTQYRSIHFPDT